MNVQKDFYIIFPEIKYIEAYTEAIHLWHSSILTAHTPHELFQALLLIVVKKTQ